MPSCKTYPHLAIVIALLATMAELVSASHTLAQRTAYTVSELSAPAGGQVASRLNRLGAVAGRAGVSGGGARAIMWSRSTLQRQDLRALPGGEYSSAFAINDAGVGAGVSNTANSSVPVIWIPTSGLQRIPLLPGDNCGEAFG